MSEVSDERLFGWIDEDAPELAAHLARHPEDAARVDAIREAIGGAARAVAPEERPLPDEIAGFRVLGRLGEGGMGVVYRAEQESPRREVALKVLRAGAAATARESRAIRREGEALARLSHPGIAAVYGAGETDAGEPYLVMELVEGRPLDAWLAEEEATVRETVGRFVALGEAVDYANGRGVVHRDLKPANILVDADGRPRVLDFGLARLFGAADAGSLLPSGGGLVGTLPWMSPEQVRGDPSGVDRRTDVYALGAMLYEALTGTSPVDVSGVGIPEAARRISENPPRRPSSLRRELRGDLETIVLKALEKDPARRYATAGDLADDLRRWLDRRPISARPASLLYRFRKLVTRRPVAALLVLSLVALAAVLLVVPGGVDLFSRMTGGGYAKTSPFEGLRWKGDEPIVRVDGDWYGLESIDGIRSGLILEFCRQTGGVRWRKRFSEDLVQAMTRLGHAPGGAVDLVLTELETGSRFEIRGVRLRESKRQAIWRDRHRTPFERVRWADGGLLVFVDGRWLELVAIDGVPFTRVAETGRREAGPEWRRLLFVEPDIFTEALGHSMGETVALELRDPATGAIVHAPAAPVAAPATHVEEDAP